VPNGYSIGSTRLVQDVGPSGGLRDVYEVSFVTDAGDTGLVRVPAEGGWESAAKAAIEQEVAAMNALRA
jgi:hypothetical protein